MNKFFTIILLCLGVAASAQTKKPLAQTPPMGWNSWNYFGRAKIDEKTTIAIIDMMVSSGMKKAGYEYVVVDGGWRDSVLGPNGELRADPVKFPHGMKYLADYAHSKGLKFGLHTVPGSHDCGCSKVGGWGVEEVQYKQFVDWGLDFIKLDKCRFSYDAEPNYPRKDVRWYKGWEAKTGNLLKAYTKWFDLINSGKRDIVFSASAYKFFDWYPTLTNMGRTTGDIRSLQSKHAVFDDPKTNSVMTVAHKNNAHYKQAHPGYWNDPDMLVMGAQGLTPNEQEVHFALWCIMSAPLMVGNDPLHMTEAEKNTLLNTEAIAVDQDPTEQGHLIKTEGNTEIWAKKLKDGRYAALLINRDNAVEKQITLNWADLGLQRPYHVRDVFNKKDAGTANNSLQKNVAPHSAWFVVLKP